MNNIMHPSALLKKEWIETIRMHAMTAEQQGQLQAQQLELIYQQQWFKLLVPKTYGGLETPLPELVRLEEALSWADGSFGWVITLCAGAGWFGGFIDPEVASAIFADPKVCLAGSGAATGTADRTENGYIINGTWKYASGVKHATQLTANCIIRENGKTIFSPTGEPLILPFVIDANETNPIPAWKYIGMMGTGSHAFEVNNLTVPQNRCFQINGADKIIDAPLYNYPFLQLAEATLAANLSGMALHFINVCGPIFEEKQKSDKLTTTNRDLLANTLQEVKQDMQVIRNDFYKALDASWGSFFAGNENDLKGVSRTSRLLASRARLSVDQLYPYCGLMAASPDTEINQVWRDFHTAGQHSLLTFPD